MIWKMVIFVFSFPPQKNVNKHGRGIPDWCPLEDVIDPNMPLNQTGTGQEKDDSEVKEG